MKYNRSIGECMQCGIKINDMRIERSSVPEGKYQYKIAGDDNSGDDPVRVWLGVLINFFGTLICNNPLPIENDGVLWLKNSDFVRP